MSTTPIKSAKVRNAVKAALGVAIAAPLAFAVAPASAADVQLGETTVDIGGFIRMDMYYDFEGAHGISLTARDSLPDAADPDATFDSSVRTTRLTFSFNTPTAAGDIGGYIETDFQGDASTGGSLRVRQAYITYGNWLFGKAWSVWNNFNYGPTVDFGGPTGITFSRNKQVRYTFDLGGGSNFAIALEDEYLEGAPSVLPSPFPLSSSLPMLTMRYQGGSDVFSYQAAGFVRSVEVPGPADDSATSWGLNLGGTLSFASGTSFALAAHYTEGDGLMMLDGTDISDWRFDSHGDLQLAENWSVVATVAQQFTDTLSGSLVYGYDEKSFDDIHLTGTSQSVSVNMFYSPADPLTFGVGYKFVSQETESGSVTIQDADASRLVFTTTYAF